MREESLAERVTAARGTEKQKTDVVQIQKNWLLFMVNDSCYAVESCLIREIIRDAQVFPLPFVPTYISGLINRHGDPYTVIDTALLFGLKAQKSSLFLVINDHEQSCLRASDVIEFRTTNVDEVQSFSDSVSSQFFTGLITLDGKEIPVINIQAVHEQVRKDLSAN